MRTSISACRLRVAILYSSLPSTYIQYMYCCSSHVRHKKSPTRRALKHRPELLTVYATMSPTSCVQFSIACDNRLIMYGWVFFTTIWTDLLREERSGLTCSTHSFTYTYRRLQAGASCSLFTCYCIVDISSPVAMSREQRSHPLSVLLYSSINV